MANHCYSSETSEDGNSELDDYYLVVAASKNAAKDSLNLRWPQMKKLSQLHNGATMLSMIEPGGGSEIRTFRLKGWSLSHSHCVMGLIRACTRRLRRLIGSNQHDGADP